MGEDVWGELDDPSRQIQSRVLEEYRRFSSILEVLFKAQPEDTLKTFQEEKKLILNVIQQQWDEHTYFGNCSKALDTARKALNTQVSLLKRLYSISENKYVVIPDTNALLFNPELQEWSFELVRQFTIVLLPTVLSELDKLKMDHRSESVRQKAEKLIRQIKEYRRRGRLTNGVTLVRNRSEIIAIAVEPKFSESLSWLDAHNNDDRLLASCLEIMRQMPDAQVVLSTRDINLQNKAEFARIPFIEPPEITGGA
jgi:rRNA-processing protein FCF1